MTKEESLIQQSFKLTAFPMSGGDDNYKSTFQAVAAAEIVQNEKPSCLY